MAKQRIPITTIDSTYSDGDILYGYDVNRIIDVFREAANTNKLDINKILTGTDYKYIAEDITGLNQLASEDSPVDGQKGFIFNGLNQNYLEIYTYSDSTSFWNYLADISLLNPYTESISIEGKVIDVNDSTDLLQVDMDGIKLQIGQQIFFQVKYLENVQKGDAIQFVGAQGNHFTAKKAVQSEINQNPEFFIGLAARDYNSNNFGLVLEFGPLIGVLKTEFTAGSVLWYDSENNIPGKLTTEKPLRGFAQIRVAAVINSQNAQLGQWFVRPDRLELADRTKIFVQQEEPTNVLQDDLWYDIS